jgi:hypothetical protein
MLAAGAARADRISIRRSARAAALLVSLVLVQGAVGATTTALSLRSAAADLERSVDLLKAGRSVEAQRMLLHALLHAERASRRAPTVMWTASAIGLDDDLTTLQDISRAVADTSVVALKGLSALDSSVGRGDAATSIYSEGRVHPGGVATLERLVGDISIELRRVLAELEGSPAPSISAVARALTTARFRLASAVEASERGSQALGLLPALSGLQGERRYLLAFQAPAEARGGGGLIGLYGILRAANGGFELEHVGSTREITGALSGPVRADRWFEKAYGPLSSLDDFRQVNLSPIFPTVAQTALRMYRSATGVALDGMISMDPVVLGKLTRATGPLTAPGWDVQVKAATARRVLMHDIYLKFGRWHSKLQNAYLAGLVDELWTRMRSDDLDASALVAALGESAEAGRLKIFLSDPEDESRLAELRVDGDPRNAGPNPQMVWNNNWAGNKVDYFLKRSISTTVNLDGATGATITTHVSVENQADPDEASLLTRAGIRSDLPVGANLMTLSMLLPEGAVVESVDVTGSSTFKKVDEGGSPSLWVHLGLPAGGRGEMTVTYRLTDVLDGEGRVAFTLVPQSTVRPDRFSIVIVPPAGRRLLTLDRGRATDDGSVTAQGVLKIPKTFRAVLGTG